MTSSFLVRRWSLLQKRTDMDMQLLVLAKKAHFSLQQALDDNLPMTLRYDEFLQARQQALEVLTMLPSSDMQTNDLKGTAAETSQQLKQQALTQARHVLESMAKLLVHETAKTGVAPQEMVYNSLQPISSAIFNAAMAEYQKFISAKSDYDTEVLSTRCLKQPF